MSFLKCKTLYYKVLYFLITVFGNDYDIWPKLKDSSGLYLGNLKLSEVVQKYICYSTWLHL